MTEITASTAGSVVVTDAGNNLAQVTPAPIDLPVVGVVDDFYEPREGMRVTFVDTLTVVRVLRAGPLRPHRALRGRPAAAVHRGQRRRASPGYAAHLDNLDRRRVILDDDNNIAERVAQPARRQPVRLPPAGQRRLLGRHAGHRLLPRRRPGQRPDRRPALVVRRATGHRRLAHPARPPRTRRRSPSPTRGRRRRRRSAARSRPRA